MITLCNLVNMLQHPMHTSRIAYKIFPVYLRIRHTTPCTRLVCTAAVTPPSFDFTITHSEPAFPEIRDTQQPVVVLGIDPDVRGAIASLTLTPPSLTRLSQRTAMLDAAHVHIYDMPTEVWTLSRREKQQPCPQRLLELFSTIEAANGTAILRAAFEFTTPGILSGKYAWYGSGYGTGLFMGMLMSRNIPCVKVSAAAWKRQLGLTKAGKEGSLALARALFPAAATTYLRRKKDHGRAEALLIAAWALGLRAEVVQGPPQDQDAVDTIDR